MSDFRILSDTMLASPQISPGDLATARNDGVTLIINNRPEGEAQDQTPGPEIEAEARKQGMDYLAIPITHAGFSAVQVEELAKALAGAQGKVLGYCRSGTRSTLLWALARSSMGDDPDQLAEAARSAGYDVSSIHPAMEALAANAKA